MLVTSHPWSQWFDCSYGSPSCLQLVTSADRCWNMNQQPLGLELQAASSSGALSSVIQMWSPPAVFTEQQWITGSIRVWWDPEAAEPQTEDTIQSQTNAVGEQAAVSTQASRCVCSSVCVLHYCDISHRSLKLATLYPEHSLTSTWWSMPHSWGST